MEFRQPRGIYTQIAEHFTELIIAGDPGPGERFPSIRETSVDMEVNPNTVARAYSILQEKKIIENRRGLGFFVAHDGREKAREWRRKEFIDRELPAVFRAMRMTGLDVGDLDKLYMKYCAEADSEEK